MRSHALTLNLAADPINAPGALLNRRRIPAQVMMDNMPALPVQVDPFLSDRSGNEDLWSVRRVESEEIPVAVLGVTLYKLDDVAVFSPGVIARQQGMILLGTNEGLQIGMDAITQRFQMTVERFDVSLRQVVSPPSQCVPFRHRPGSGAETPRP